MSDTVIKAENLGKKYLIGHQSSERYTALRDVLARSARNALHKTRQLLSGRQLLEGDSVEEFWALQDVNFEIKRGDRVGIIGRNGAGKSTLLKILSRITEPSAGRVEITGRVASLLEVGTGFHPELTGRENIFLNGAILGMTRAEIKRKFDEMVDFAGVEKFLDTPVKRYSSGMYVRLAFSVAAHLEPEILIVDEVLAVGDAEFQKKCLGKMEDVSKGEGRTVLFVSHNMSAVQSLCRRVMLIDKGNIVHNGDVLFGVRTYLEGSFQDKNSIWEGVNISADHAISILNVQVSDKDGIKDEFSNSKDLDLDIKYQVYFTVSYQPRIVLSLFNQDGINIFNIAEFINIMPGIFNFRLKLPGKLLSIGSYSLFIRVDIPKNRIIIDEHKYIGFSISELDFHQFKLVSHNEPGGVIHPQVTIEQSNCY